MLTSLNQNERIDGVSSTIRSSLTERGVWSCAVVCSKVWNQKARGLLISYESLLADAEDLVENSRDEQNSESDYDDEEDWIDHETRVLSYFRQCASRPRRREQVVVQLAYTGNRNVSYLLRESVDTLHHLSVVVADYVCSFGSHHLFRV